MPWQGIPLEEAMPNCERGDLFTVDEIKLVEKQTSPPDYLTEAELITLMEKHGIGIPQNCLSRSGQKDKISRSTAVEEYVGMQMRNSQEMEFTIKAESVDFFGLLGSRGTAQLT